MLTHACKCFKMSIILKRKRGHVKIIVPFKGYGIGSYNRVVIRNFWKEWLTEKGLLQIKIKNKCSVFS